jgi:Flp pilus assembly protein TadD
VPGSCGSAQLNLGSALAQIGMCSEAVPVLEGLVATNSEVWQALYWLSTCYRELGRIDEADSAMRRNAEARGSG